MKGFAGRIAFVALFVILTASPAWAQATAALAGRVTDQSGAVLPGVTVTATQTDTGFARTVVTDGTGAWVMPNLPTGPYRLEVSLQGFRTYVQTGIVLQVGATPTINAVLGVGSLEETVSVEAAAPIVDVRSAGISEVVEQERIVELPLQGRQVTDLIVLAGAAVETGRPNSRSFQGGVNISVAGGVSFGVAYLLDGAMHNDPQNAGGMPLPFPDALQEFSVGTSGLSAQYGIRSGASVNAVTKSGTSRFTGNAFEFLRDKRFNAKSPFARIDPITGRRRDDGLRRNQLGGTFGGPIVRDRLFFFTGYQGTFTRTTPADRISYVPTAAMLAGDFTAIASPACNNGRQLNLGAGFVGNRISPAAFSPAALRIAGFLPKTDDPCGEIRWSLPDDRDEGQYVGRVDYQLNPDHTIFGRYMATTDDRPSPLDKSDNILTTVISAVDNMAQSFTWGDTIVLGTNAVNSLRFAFNRTVVDRFQRDFFQPSDVGIKAHNYSPTREMLINVTGGFNISAATASRGIAENNAYQLGEDLTLVRGRHQIGIGANVAYWRSLQRTWARAPGTWAFDGQVTGLGLADFLLGRVSALEHGDAGGLTFDQWYVGTYVQDAWRATDRVTLNAGIRWEPFLGQNVIRGSVFNFDHDKFLAGVKSTVFRKAPAGFIYPGDPGSPGGTGMHAQWWNFSPRAGVAWDVHGDGRMAVRSSYGIAYDYPTGEYQFQQASAPPYGNRSRVVDPPGRMDDPYAHLGGDPHPLVIGPDTGYIPFGTFGVMDPNINSPRVQSWNVTLERQVGADWGVAASYLGSSYDRLWDKKSLNPGVYMGLGPCTIAGVFYPVCSTNANLNNRRVLYQERPEEAQFIGPMDQYVDVGTKTYRGLRLTIRRRSADGISLNGNYTLSRCYGLEMGSGGGGFDAGFLKPDDPDFDRGHCDDDRTHLANLTVGYQTPQFGGAVVRALTSSWRLSGILNARSGSWLTVTTGRDNAFTGIASQRVNQISGDVYGEKSLNSYLNRAAFAQPAGGTFGDHVRNSIRGPNFWKIDLAVSRLFAFGTAQTLEGRIEVFNVLNNFNWGNPTTNFNAQTFGRITSQAGDPRILQFGVKYSF
ncbi:MAG: carboxypeptidase regulatory-like domain-containing protein [Acidimicrobiia bacterium]|nr:carboxypeptidase regulatory-like domain-containing protein [Acidimicrobiia bacterium]